MRPAIPHQLDQVLKHLYINPLEKCNLKCKICYTKKTSPILTQTQILSFIDKYQAALPLETVTFCGGEVFALTDFPSTMNEVVKRGIYTQVITNGTIDRLDELENPNMISLIVSLDGLPQYHDKNRGEGNFQKSLAFMQKAQQMGFMLHVFSIVTKQNLPDIDAFTQYLAKELGESVEITFHPRKPPSYLLHHPVSNIVGEVDGFDFLSPEEMVDVLRTRPCFPPKDLGCYQIAAVSDGQVYGCCEGVVPIGKMTDDIGTLKVQMEKRLEQWETMASWKGCLGCTQPEFMCGIKSYLEQLAGESSYEEK